MLKRNAIPLALVLVTLALWTVRPATGDEDGGEPPAPTVDQQLADHEERLADLERQLGEPARAAGSIDARLSAIELEVAQLERDLAEADGEDGDGDDGTMLRALQRRLDALATRIERIDRNRLNTVERDITNLQREVRDLNQRLRRVE